MTLRRAVITGMGTVNPLGGEVAGYWKALCAGQSGISRIEQFDVSAFKVHFGG
ncbi:MAG TPA: beta-ketoacyl synthase N-terminal-like domain-containing protein, partial [Gemmataceae bacterium]